jgi:uncharacterized protein YjbI with pentapeptide repeats
MSEKTSFEQEMEKIIQLVKEAKTDNFFELAKILGRNPKKDFAGADLHNCDLSVSGGDLQGADLRRTNLSSANLKGVNLRGADLSFADLSGADFTGADLRGTIFDNVRAENAIFCDNAGLYERLKLNLLDRGAIFKEKLEQAPIPNNEEVENDDNDIAFNKLMEDSAKCSQYKGKFVAFINGKLIAAEEDNSKIKEAIQNYLSKNPQYEKESRFIKKVTQEVLNRVIEFS